jgi:hypothetical protein
MVLLPTLCDALGLKSQRLCLRSSRFATQMSLDSTAYMERLSLSDRIRVRSNPATFRGADTNDDACATDLASCPQTPRCFNESPIAIMQRNVCVFAGTQLDRSPTGTGTAGHVAILAARGLLQPGGVLANLSIIHSVRLACLSHPLGSCDRHCRCFMRDTREPQLSARISLQLFQKLLVQHTSQGSTSLSSIRATLSAKDF